MERIVGTRWQNAEGSRQRCGKILITGRYPMRPTPQSGLMAEDRGTERLNLPASSRFGVGLSLPAGHSTGKREKLGGTGGTRDRFSVLLPVLQAKARELPMWDFGRIRWDLPKRGGTLAKTGGTREREEERKE